MSFFTRHPNVLMHSFFSAHRGDTRHQYGVFLLHKNYRGAWQKHCIILQDTPVILQNFIRKARES
jgi:hypothetical protein